jgi:hypothetical protein
MTHMEICHFGKLDIRPSVDATLHNLLATITKDYMGTAPMCCCSLCKPNACRYQVNSCVACSKCGARFYRHCEKSLMKEWDVKYSDGKFNVVTPPGSIEIPASLADKTHWGHVAWKCCTLLESLRGG